MKKVFNKYSLVAILMLFAFFVYFATYYFVEYKKDFKVIKILDDSTRVVQYRTVRLYKCGLERKRKSEFVETTYCFSENCKDIQECVNWLLYKEKNHIVLTGNKHF